MNRLSPMTWSRLAETALLSLVFLAPLAAHPKTWDPQALPVALMQTAAVGLFAAWLLKGLARGRWEAAASSWTALVPALALIAWAAVVFAFSSYKIAAAPGFIGLVAGGVLFSISLLEFGGARHAMRLSFWTAAAAALACGEPLARRFFGLPFAMTFADPGQLASFAAVATPIVLGLLLDPEATSTRKTMAVAAAACLALSAGWIGDARGLISLVLAVAAFATLVVIASGGRAAREAAAAAVICAAVAALSAREGAHRRASWGSLTSAGGPLSDLGRGIGMVGAGWIGPALLAWAVLAATIAGLRAARELRRQGALAESGYAAAFAAAFAAWGLSSLLGLAAEPGPGAWLAWAAGGIAAGLGALARPGGVVRTWPIPAGEEIRRWMQGPLLILFIGSSVWPGLWLASDVRFNRAVARARAGDRDGALADAVRVWPGSPVYPSALDLQGAIDLEEGKPQEALAEYARLENAFPDFPRVHARKARAYAALGDWAAASRERALQDRLTPLDVENLIAWAESARASGDLTAARRAAARAAALAPDDPAARLQVAANALLSRRRAPRRRTRISLKKKVPVLR